MRILTLLLLAAVATADGPKRAGYLGARLGARANRKAGVVLQQVLPKTPAAEAGLQKGDIVVRIGKEAVANPAELGAQLRAHGAGAQVDIVVIRGGEEKTVAVKLFIESLFTLVFSKHSFSLFS